MAKIELNDFGENKKNNVPQSNVEDTFDDDFDFDFDGETEGASSGSAAGGKSYSTVGSTPDEFINDCIQDDDRKASASEKNNTYKGPTLADLDSDDSDTSPSGEKRTPAETKKIITAVAIAASVVGVVIIGLFIYILSVANQSTIYNGIYINGKDLGGMTQKEAAVYISSTYVAPVDNAKVTVRLNDKDYETKMTDFVVSPDANMLAEIAYRLHRDEGLFARFSSILDLRSNPYYLPLEYEITDQKLDAFLKGTEDFGFSDAVNPTYTVKDNLIQFTAGKKGTSIDKDAFKVELLTSLSAFQDEIQKLGTIKSLKDIVIETNVTTVDFKHLDAEAIYSEVHVAAENPVFYRASDGSIAISSGKNGRTVNKSSLTAIVEKTNKGEQYEYESVRFETEYPQYSVSEMKERMYTKTFSTVSTSANVEGNPYSASDAERRAKNLKTVATKLGSKELLSGESYDFSALLGEIASYKGFVNAKELTAENKDIVGGGVSQAASAVYVAALKAGLNVSTHKNGQYLPYFGVKGFDAYISAEDDANLVIKSNSKYPVKIQLSFSGNTLKVDIIGTDDSAHGGVELSTNRTDAKLNDDGFVVYTYTIKTSKASLGTVSYISSDTEMPVSPTGGKKPTASAPATSPAKPTSESTQTAESTSGKTETAPSTEPSAETNTAKPTSAETTPAPSTQTPAGSEYSVILDKYPVGKRAQIALVVNRYTGLSYAKAYSLIENTPIEVMKDTTYNIASQFASALIKEGATAYIGEP